jgi:hypothetical protein
VHELTIQTFWGTPLALLPSAILLHWLVQLRVSAVLSSPRAGTASGSLERARLLRKATLACGFAIAGSGFAALTSGVCVVFRVAGLLPLLAMQTVALLAMIFTAAALTVESSAALRELTEPVAADRSDDPA